MSNSLWLPIENAMYLVAHTDKFQEIVGAANVTAALEHIYPFEASDLTADQQTMPRAIVGPVPGRMITINSTTGIKLNGSIFVAFEFPIAEDELGDPRASGKTFQQQVETIIDEMILRVTGQTGGGGFLAVRHFKEEVSPTLAQIDELGDRGQFWFNEWHLILSGP